MEQGGQAGDVVLGHFEDCTDNEILECIICGHPNGLWFIRAYIPVDPEEENGLPLEEARGELAHLRLIQPENRYTIVNTITKEELNY